MSQTPMTPDMKAESSETSSEKLTKAKSPYTKDDSDTVMMRVKSQKMKMMRDKEAPDYIETTKKMVKFFAADENYEGTYVMVSGVKVYIEGTVEETEEKESESIHKRNNAF